MAVNKGLDKGNTDEISDFERSRVALNKRLGKGLAELLSSGNSAQKEANKITASLEKNAPGPLGMLSGRTIVMVRVTMITPNPRQPRKFFDRTALEELAESIKIHGVIQPLLVRKKGDVYELVAGERRWRAAQLASIENVPVVIKDMSDEVSLEQAIIENVQRADLNALEEAESYSLLMKEFLLTQEQVADKVGKSRSAVANILRLNELPREVKDSLLKNEITAGHAKAILSAGNIVEQLKVWNAIVKHKLNVRDSEKIATQKTFVKDNKTKSSVELDAFAQKLASKLVTKVELSGTEHSGTITIRYFSRDELDRLYALLINNEVI
ncbi:chromosome partitioning protein ParB [Candidatus Termititenax spirochaetophilus]|uniref:Chromosome partitioning protein ParB n=1 Tax=Candidatus Termititenax spirochaetophilus TaxID=2218522 RepID=A0A388T734_9BACT|nr:chromosome partitioning protein ParB [Candidatus Termititenax spirochaetophilus]